MAQFDYDSIYNRLVANLQAKSSTADLLFYSTNARILSAIAEEINYMANYDEFLSRETKWTQARNRTSLMAFQGIHGYNAHRKIGASGTLKISAVETFDAPPAKNIDIPKWTVFSDEILGIKFSTITATAITTADNFVNIEVYQGTPKSQAYIGTGLGSESIDILSDSVDNAVVEVWVNAELWSKVDSILGSTSTAKEYEIVNAIDFSKITVQFGDGVFGLKLTNGDSVEIKYLETTGGEGNIRSQNLVTKVESTVYDVDSDEVTIYSTNEGQLIGGSEYETAASIRLNAPLIFQTGDRATTTADYIAIIDSYDYIQKVIVWGAYETNLDNGDTPWTFIPSEENLVHVSAITTSNENLSTAQKLDVSERIQENQSPTDILQFVDAFIVGLVFTSEVFVSNRNYTLSEVKSNVQAALDTEYSLENMDFFKPVYYSDYQRFIDEVTGVDHHNTSVALSEAREFSSAYVIETTLSLSPISPSSVKIYVKDLTVGSPVFELIGIDDGDGGFIAESSYALTGSAINYTNRELILVVTSGLSEAFTDYEIRVVYSLTSNNLVPRFRQSIFDYSDELSTVTVNYV